MIYYSAWPMIVSMGLLLLIARHSWFAAADVPPSKPANRISALDGLRGYLAYGVFFGHAAMYHRFMLDGTWTGAGTFFTLIAQGAVCLFFMITGYLFWGKLLDECGKPNWTALYLGRFFRLGPLYLFAVACMYLLILSKAGFRFTQPLTEFASDAINWLSIGISPYRPNINGYAATNSVLAGVTWTLLYEWRFYASLLLLGLLARFPKWSTAAVVAGLLVCWTRSYLSPKDGFPLALAGTIFLSGMLAASLERDGYLVKGAQWLKSIALLGVLACYFLFSDRGYAAGPAGLLGIAFYLIISGANPLGALTNRAARQIGDISFSIYLLQGIVLASVFSVSQVRAIALSSPAAHWLLMAGCAIILLCFARMTFVYIECPGIKLGRVCIKRLYAERESSAPLHAV